MNLLKFKKIFFCIAIRRQSDASFACLEKSIRCILLLLLKKVVGVVIIIRGYLVLLGIDRQMIVLFRFVLYDGYGSRYGFQRSEGGLFVDLNSFLAYGKDHVGWNFEKTGNPVYLHIKQTRKLVAPEDRPSKKPTLLAIGGLFLHFDKAIKCLKLYLFLVVNRFMSVSLFLVCMSLYHFLVGFLML